MANMATATTTLGSNRDAHQITGTAGPDCPVWTVNIITDADWVQRWYHRGFWIATSQLPAARVRTSLPWLHSEWGEHFVPHCGAF